MSFAVNIRNSYWHIYENSLSNHTQTIGRCNLILHDTKKKLTPKLIENLPPASGKRYEVRDELLTDLLLRVSATGAKVWYLATRIDGRSRRLKLGSWPILSQKDAREKAQMILRDIQLGLFQERQDEPAPKSLTLGDVIPLFTESTQNGTPRTRRELRAYYCA